MKATGIVRRIDELGRIVIPKEIRRSMRIRQMDSLEIYTSGDGEIVLKKFTPIGEMATFVKDYAEAMAKVTGRIVCITDRENVVAVSGIGRRELENARVSKELAAAMLERRYIFASVGTSDYIQTFQKETVKFSHQIVCPVISDGDVLGSVVMLGREGVAALTDGEAKIVAVAADFMGRYMAA